LILAATRDAARLFRELGTVTIVLAVGARLAACTGFSSIPLYLVAGIVLGALAPPRLTRWPCRRARRKIEPTTASATMAEAIAVDRPDPISTTPTRGR
jgi:Kef-type K+ transport system membrane component KefB